MKFQESTITVLLKKDMHFSESSELIGKSIARSMVKDEDLKKYHRDKVYKYVFNNFYPLEEGGIYKANRMYIFKLRCIDKNYAVKIKSCLQHYESNELKVISADIREIGQKTINFLETINPAIITIDSKPWTKDKDMLILIERLHANAEKKYKYFYNTEIADVEDYFIEKLKILNRKPMYYSYKGMKLIGNKFRIKVNEDEKSQKLAFAALGCGLAEKNSILGAGYCKCDWR